MVDEQSRLDVDNGQNSLRRTPNPQSMQFVREPESIDGSTTWIGDLEAAVAILTSDAENIFLVELSRGWLRTFELSRAATVGRPLQDIFTTEASMMLANVTKRVLSSRTPVEFSILAGEPRRKIGLVARASPQVANAVVLEADLPDRPLRSIDGSNEALFLDMASNAVMGAGSIYFDGPGQTGDIDLAVVLGYPVGHPAARRERLDDLVHPEDVHARQVHRDHLAEMSDNQFGVVVNRMRHFDGDWRFVQLRERVVARTADGGLKRVLAYATDVSEKYRLMDSLGAVSNALFVAESHERKRIARELHDSVAQHLVAIDLTLMRLERRTDDQAEQRDMIKEIREALKAAHSEVRTFSYLLHPPDLDVLGFEASLTNFLRGFGFRTGLELNLHIAEDWPALGPVRELALFRVVQEALMNVHNHAEAQRVEVSLTRSGARVALEIADDGVGLSQEQIDSLMAQHWGGVGIAGMTARMEQLGGKLEMRPRPKGLVIRAELPAPAEEPGSAANAAS